MWLCTLRPNGSPHVTPVWFVYDAGCWWIGTDTHAVKVRNIEADPRVSLALEDGRSPVVAEGKASVRRDGFPAEIVAAFAEKYAWDVTAPTRPGSGRCAAGSPCPPLAARRHGAVTSRGRGL